LELTEGIYMNRLFRIFKSIVLGIKYLKNPWIFFKILISDIVILIPKRGEPLTIRSRLFIHYMDILNNGWFYKDGTFQNGKYKFKVKEPRILEEDIIKMYEVDDLKDKNILDIGGLYGETAIMLLKEFNAGKVFVYEPVKENFNLIKENLLLNNCGESIKPYNLGVSNKSGFITLQTANEPGAPGFGMPGKEYTITFEVISWDSILNEHKDEGIYLAKVDCEGGEKYLVDADKDLIKKIPNWVIETHSHEIESNMKAFFRELGFNCELREVVDSELGVSVWYFWE